MLKPEDLIELLMDDKVLNALTARIVAAIRLEFDAFKLEIHESLRKSTSEMLEERCEGLENRLSQLESENKTLRTQVNSIENTTFKSTIVIQGLEPTEQERLPRGDSQYKGPVNTFMNFAHQKMNLQLQPQDVYCAYRLPGDGKAQSCQPMVIQFTTKCMRDTIYYAKKALRTKLSSDDKPIYINEYLTKSNAKIFARSRQLVKEKSLYRAWTSGGVIYIKRSDNLHDKPCKILSMCELEKLLPS